MSTFRLLDRPGTEREITEQHALNDAGCFFCAFVGANMTPEAAVGAVFFIEEVETGLVRKVEFVKRLGPLRFFACLTTSATVARAEIAEHWRKNAS